MAKAELVEIVATDAAFDALATEWRALHDACGRSVFQSFEWNRAWWRAFGGGRGHTLHIVTVRDGGALIAIAPFFEEKSRVVGVLPLRTLRWIGASMSDYQDVLVAPERAHAAFAALAGRVAAAGAEVLSLNDMPEEGDATRALSSALRDAGFAGDLEPGAPCPRLLLQPTWDDTLAAMKPSHAKRIAYIDRKLKRNFRVAVEVATPETLTADFDLFVEMHQSRWTADGQPGVMSSPQMIGFHREVVGAFAQRGWLSLSFLSLDGKRVVANYAFKRNGVLEFYLSGAADDDAARKFAPGILLHVYNIQALIAEGGSVYDFLRGDERYKYELGAVDRRNRSVVLLNRLKPYASALHVARKAQQAAWRLGARAKRELGGRLGAGSAAAFVLDNPAILAL
jgi:CelD/BcsL family acetyltransferase involved in cellulose biosynthesis